MRYLSLGEVVRLHQLLIEQSGGAGGIRDLGLLDSALAQPRATFAARTCTRPWSTRPQRCARRWFRTTHLSMGNKRVGHAAMATFLLLNGTEIVATTDEQENLMLEVAAGKRNREDVAAWLRNHSKNLGTDSAV